MSTNRVVWKYTLPHNGATFNLDKEAKVVHVGVQDGALCIWIEHDPEQGGDHVHDFTVVGTGHPVPEFMNHVGSCFQGPFVWHIYRKVRVFNKD